MKKPWLLMLAAVLLPIGVALAAAAGGMTAWLDPAPPPPAPTTAPLSLAGKWILAGMSGDDELSDGPDRLAGSLPQAATPNALDATTDDWAGDGVASLSSFALEWLDGRPGDGASHAAPSGLTADMLSLVGAISAGGDAGPGLFGAGSSGGDGGSDGDNDVGNGIDLTGGEAGSTPGAILPAVPLPSAALLFAAGLGGVSVIGMRKRRI